MDQLMANVRCSQYLVPTPAQCKHQSVWLHDGRHAKKKFAAYVFEVQRISCRISPAILSKSSNRTIERTACQENYH